MLPILLDYNAFYFRLQQKKIVAGQSDETKAVTFAVCIS